MSTLNTRKDRDRNGKAKLHNHSGIPTLTGKWRHPSMDCWVNYSTPGDHEWKRLYTTLRRRADDRRQCGRSGYLRRRPRSQRRHRQDRR